MVEGVVGEIESALRAVATSERAARERRYLRSSYAHLGSTVPDARRVALGLVRSGAVPGHAELVELVGALWSRKIFELRLVGALLLGARAELLGEADLVWLRRLCGEAGTWALLDVMAGEVVGSLLAREPALGVQLDSWAKDGDFWIRRAALLAWLKPLRSGASMERFLEYADAMLEEREFFVRKAIGWVLREAGKSGPAEVCAWLAPRTSRASGVTVREAVKYLPPDRRDALLAGYREHRATIFSEASASQPRG